MSPDQLTALLNTELGESVAWKVPGEQVTQLEGWRQVITFDCGKENRFV